MGAARDETALSATVATMMKAVEIILGNGLEDG
jgi:hypothetical protein